MPGGKLGHAIPNGGRGGMLGKGSSVRQARQPTRVRPPETQLGATGGEPSPVYRDRRSLTRRGRQNLENNVRASWRSLQNDGTMAMVALTMVALVGAMAIYVDLRAALVSLLSFLPLGPERSKLLLGEAVSWQILEAGCWWSAALLLAFFTWLLFAAVFDTIGMVMGTAPALAAGGSVVALRIAPLLCFEERPLGEATAADWGGVFCYLPWLDQPRLLLGGTLVLALLCAAFCKLAMFALRPRLPGPDQQLALLSISILVAIGAMAYAAPEAWLVVQMAAGWFAAVEDPVPAALDWGSWAHLETGVWAAGAILLAFFSWLMFAALFDKAGMLIGILPSLAAACCVILLRLLPAACRAERLVSQELYPRLCDNGNLSLYTFPALCTSMVLLLGGSLMAHHLHKFRRKKVLVVHHDASPRPRAATERSSRR